jgi:hypothetical protein
LFGAEMQSGQQGREPGALARPACAFQTIAQGECAQVDWGPYGTVAVDNTRRRLSFFVMVLAFSRRMYVEFTVSQTMEHFLACHERAFAAWGGVPSKIMVDNLKSAVLQRLAGTAPVFNPRYTSPATTALRSFPAMRTEHTTTKSERTYRCRRTRRIGVMCAEQGAHVRRRSWAGYAINMFEFEFPTGTRGLVMNWKERNASRW